MNLIVGFTGTREGLTHKQRESLRSLLEELTPKEVHHGDCVGADAEFHAVIRQAAYPCKIVIHPPSSDRLRANCTGDSALPPRSYLIRNAEIVSASNVLIGCPSGEEKQRSGTWSTIRLARKKKMPLYVITPDGKVHGS